MKWFLICAYFCIFIQSSENAKSLNLAEIFKDLNGFVASNQGFFLLKPPTKSNNLKKSSTRPPKFKSAREKMNYKKKYYRNKNVKNG